MKSVVSFFSIPFPLLDDSGSKLFLILFSGIFATFFIYFYHPFNLLQMNYHMAFGRFLSIWTAGFIGALILCFTQSFLRSALKLNNFNVGQFVLSKAMANFAGFTNTNFNF